MKRLSLIVLLQFFIISSCTDFSILERDQKNIFFYENIVDVINNDGSLFVATFNMKLGFCQTCDPFSDELGGDFEQLDRIVNMINILNLDIVSLQEVAHEYDTSIIENQIKYIAERTNMNYAYGMGRALQTGSNLFLRGFIGNAILSKYEIVSVKNPVIRYIDYFSQNHSLNVKLKLNNIKEILIVNTHLQSGSTNDEKKLQINQILEEIKNESIPIILTGDFNLSYRSNSQFLLLLENDFVNSLEEIDSNERANIIDSGTFLSGSVIDFIFTSKNDFNIQSVALAPIEFRDISDHFAYMVNISLNDIP